MKMRFQREQSIFFDNLESDLQLPSGIKGDAEGSRSYCSVSSNNQVSVFYCLSFVLLLQGEKPPHAFCLIDKNLNQGLVSGN